MAEIRSGIAIDPVELVYAGFLEALLATRHLLECSDIRRYHYKVTNNNVDILAASSVHNRYEDIH